MESKMKKLETLAVVYALSFGVAALVTVGILVGFVFVVGF